MTVERGGSSGYLWGLFVGAYDGKFAIVACPKSDQGNDNGCINWCVVVSIEEDSGGPLAFLWLMNREDGIPDVDSMMEGELVDVWEQCCVIGAGEVKEVQRAWDAAIRRGELS